MSEFWIWVGVALCVFSVCLWIAIPLLVKRNDAYIERRKRTVLSVREEIAHWGDAADRARK